MTLPLPGPAKGDCEGRQDRCTVGERCPLFGTLRKEDRDGARRVDGCGDKVAAGRAAMKTGDRQATRARRRLRLRGPSSRHEEHWRGDFRVEVKSGVQVNPILRRFARARAQSEAARPIGDTRPFMFIAMPDEGTDGVVVMSLADVEAFIVPLLDEAAG